ncbi:MAG: hypothetical protein KIS92_19610, partial [Planctomycetota bacterium]|nr:hypothetical protein [Planctomycetota bacterium]
NTNEIFEDLELVKMGQDPTSQRLDAGKSTIIRAFKIEKVRAQRAKTEAEVLQDEIARMRKYMLLSFVLSGILMVALVLVLLLSAFK